MTNPTIAALAVLATVSFPSKSFAEAPQSILEEGLNAAGALDTAQQNLRAKACVQAEKILEKAIPLATKHPQVKGVVRLLRNTIAHRCSSHERIESGIESSSTVPSVAIWSSQPRCNAGIGPIAHCKFDHENGRGLFAMAQNTEEENPHYLVCAMSAGEGAWLFQADYIITGTCVVSEINWKEPGDRADVKGVFDWLEKRAPRNPIEMPFTLVQQCDTAFQDAAFCTPNMLVLSTRNKNVFDVCALHTHRSDVNAIVFRVANAVSHWDCESKDLREIDFQPSVVEPEWPCVATDRGTIRTRCILPFLPAYEDVLTQSHRYPDTPN